MRFCLTGFAASVLMCVATSGVAHAQWPCPGGPGPGEVQIGVMGGSHGVMATPLCANNGAVSSDDFDDGGSSGGGYRAPLPDIYMVVVTHHDTSAWWTSAGYPTEDAARRAALEGCKRAMGEGCAVLWKGRNDFVIAAVTDAAGLVFLEAGDFASDAQKKAMTECSAVSTGCRNAGLIENSGMPKDSFPRGRPSLYRYAVVAWPETLPAEAWRGRSWLASGVEGYDKAVAAAVARCKADTGVNCVRGQHSANGVLVRYVDDKGVIHWVSAPNAEAAKQVATKTCPEGRQCRVVDITKATDTRTAVIEELKSDRPMRGFYAVFWSSTPSAVRPLAIVTGEPTLEGAKRAAKALCEKESKGACVPFLTDDDWGTEQFIKVLSDSKDVTRIEFGYSTADVAAKMEASCKKDGATCSGGRVIDVGARASLMVTP